MAGQRHSDVNSGAHPRALAALAEAVARDAAGLIVRRRAEGVTVAGTKSTPTDVVTRVDQESEQFIRARLLGARPHDGVIGEEGTSVAGSTGVTWIVDPIDGTVNYLYNIPTYAVSIAAQVGDTVIAGAVADAARGETWTASRGGGAYLDSGRIQITDSVDLSNALVATGFGYAAEQRTSQVDVLRHLVARIRDIRSAGVSSLDLCSVASGRVDGYYERGLKEWDSAAGLLIAEEAGAMVGGINGASPGEELVIAANPSIFADLHDLLAAAGADED